MEKKTDNYLGVIIILGVLGTMLAIGLTRDPYADSAGQAFTAINTANEPLSFVWTNKVAYAPGEFMLIKWRVPEQYHNSLMQIHLVSEDTGGHFILSRDLDTLKRGELLTNAPDVSLKGNWYVRVTTQPYTSTSPTWDGRYITVG